MGVLIAFIGGLLIGGCFGMICTAIIAANGRNDESE